MVVASVLRVRLRSAPSYPPSPAFWLWRHLAHYPVDTVDTAFMVGDWPSPTAPIRPFAQDDDALPQTLAEIAARLRLLFQHTVNSRRVDLTTPCLIAQTCRLLVDRPPIGGGPPR